MLAYGLATLEQLKRRLGITDAVDDTLLQEILNGVSGLIENVAGRQLRREHGKTEYCTGGSSLIALRMSPLAAVHSVRESSVYDWATDGEYEELTEGTDYVVEPGPRAMLRRLRGRWAGSEFEPGQVQVRYTGGFKVDEEAAMEDRAETLSGTSVCSAGTVTRTVEPLFHQTALCSESGGDIEVIDALDNAPNAWDERGFLRFDLGQVVPIWVPTYLMLAFHYREYQGSPITMNVSILDVDPIATGASELYSAIGDSPLFSSFPTESPVAPDDVRAVSLEPATDVMLALFQSQLENGYIAFGFWTSTLAEQNYGAQILSPYTTTPAFAPSLSLSHRATLHDALTVPDDLRLACLLQASHEFQTRRSPGMMMQTMRGVGQSSGAAFQKPVADVLPEVRRVAQAYRWLY